MTPILNIALRAARQANEYIVHTIDKLDPANPDTYTDNKTLSHLETSLFQTLYDHLKRGYPKHYVCEPGETLSEPKEDSWHICEFDAASKLCRRLPSASFSIVHRHKGKAQNCLVMNIFTGDEYTATRGNGAALNSHRIRCASVRNLDAATITTNLPAKIAAHKDNPVASKDLLMDLMQQSKEIVVTGNAVIDATLAASGQTEACLLSGVRSAELEAALLIAQETGALSGGLSGNLIEGKQLENVVIANPKLYKSIVQRFGAYASKL